MEEQHDLADDLLFGPSRNDLSCTLGVARWSIGIRVMCGNAPPRQAGSPDRPLLRRQAPQSSPAAASLGTASTVPGESREAACRLGAPTSAGCFRSDVRTAVWIEA